MKRFGKCGIVSNNKIVKHKTQYQTYEKEYNYRNERFYNDVYCMRYNRHGCKAMDGPEQPRNNKALKKNKFYYKICKYKKNDVSFDFYL